MDLFVSYFMEIYSSDGKLKKSGFTYRVLDDIAEPQDDVEIRAIVRKIRESHEKYDDDIMSVVPISWKALSGKRT